MLRTALTYLLAVVLSLNGFLMPVAMAQHHATESPVTTEVTPMPHAACHGETAISADSDATTPHTAHTPDQPAAPHGPSCCTQGHCVCGCFFSTAVIHLSGGSVFGVLRDPTAEPSTPRPASTRYTVPLRPPIA